MDKHVALNRGRNKALVSREAMPHSQRWKESSDNSEGPPDDEEIALLLGCFFTPSINPWYNVMYKYTLIYCMQSCIFLSHLFDELFFHCLLKKINLLALHTVCFLELKKSTHLDVFFPPFCFWGFSLGCRADPGIGWGVGEIFGSWPSWDLFFSTGQRYRPVVEIGRLW